LRTQLMTGAVALTLIAAPAFAQVSSGNGTNLLGRGANGSTAQQNSSNNNSQSSRTSDSWKNNMQEKSSSASGERWHDNNTNVRDTTIGGVYADPQIGVYKDTSSTNASSSNNSGNSNGANSASNNGSDASSQGVHLSVPLGTDGVTLGGVQRQSAGGNAYDRSNSSSSDRSSGRATSANRANSGSNQSSSSSTPR
jgi:hypothetical protein